MFQQNLSVASTVDLCAVVLLFKIYQVHKIDVKQNKTKQKIDRIFCQLNCVS